MNLEKIKYCVIYDHPFTGRKMLDRYNLTRSEALEVAEHCMRHFFPMVRIEITLTYRVMKLYERYLKEREV